MWHYEVVNQAQNKAKHKRILRRIVCIFVALLIGSLSVAVWVYWRSMAPTVLDIAKTKIRSCATRAVNEAVLSMFGEGVDCSQFLTVERNSSDEVVLLTANSITANKLARDASIVTQTKINSLASSTIDIPLGSLSGIPLLNEQGPSVKITVSPVGTVGCSIISTFESAGINQTLYRIYLTVESRVDLIVPTMHETMEICTPVLLCETVIVGKVPQTYLQGSLLLGSC